MAKIHVLNMYVISELSPTDMRVLDLALAYMKDHQAFQNWNLEMRDSVNNLHDQILEVLSG